LGKKSFEFANYQYSTNVRNQLLREFYQLHTAKTD
jgi:hypothetical protein